MTFHFGIVNFNGGSALLDCAASILALQGAPLRLFVFDNASTDGSADQLEHRFPGVRLIRSSENVGYAGALNRMLAQMNADVVVLCNMDLQFHPDWLRNAARVLSRDRHADGLASLVVEITEPPVVNSAGIRFYGDLHPQNIGSGTPYLPGSYPAHDVVSAYGAAMCFRRSSLGDLRFDDDYFLFFEETDFYLRFALLGRRVIFVPEALVYHHRSLSTRRYSPLKLFYGERNRVTTVFKLLPVWYWPVAFSYSVRRFARLRGQVPPAGAAGHGEAVPGAVRITATILRAWAAAVARLPGTLRKRRAFWNSAPTEPADALRLLREHALPGSELTVR